jgi:HPr kinase/phosphorylase
VPLPLVRLPITPGKNVTVICEVIAMNHLLRHYGYDPAEVFARRLRERIERKGAEGARGPAERGIDWFEHDLE